MSEENIGFVRGLYEAFNKGDVADVLGSFDENIDWNEAEGMPYGGITTAPPRSPRTSSGRSRTTSTISTSRLRRSSRTASVVVLLDLQRHREGERQGAADAGGARVEVRDGKVTHFRQLADSATLNAALAVGAAA